MSTPVHSIELNSIDTLFHQLINTYKQLLSNQATQSHLDPSTPLHQLDTILHTQQLNNTILIQRYSNCIEQICNIIYQLKLNYSIYNQQLIIQSQQSAKQSIQQQLIDINRQCTVLQQQIHQLYHDKQHV